MLTPDEVIILSHIPKKKETAISRAELAASAGYSDRRSRKIISRLRQKGYLIINLQKGYYLSDDIKDLERHYWQERRRALTILKTLKETRRILKEKGIKV